MLIKVKDNDINSALRILKKRLHDQGYVKEIEAHRFYEKPSVKRRRRHQEAVKRARRERFRRHEELGIPV